MAQIFVNFEDWGRGVVRGRFAGVGVWRAIVRGAALILWGWWCEGVPRGGCFGYQSAGRGD